MYLNNPVGAHGRCLLIMYCVWSKQSKLRVQRGGEVDYFLVDGSSALARVDYEYEAS